MSDLPCDWCGGINSHYDECSVSEQKPKHIGTVERHFDHKYGARFVEIELASDKQVGGNHYKDMAIEPSEFIYRNKLNWLVGNAIKYLCRYDKKHGENDLDKAIHYIELLKQWEYRDDTD